MCLESVHTAPIFVQHLKLVVKISYLQDETCFFNLLFIIRAKCDRIALYSSERKTSFCGIILTHLKAKFYTVAVKGVLP